MGNNTLRDAVILNLNAKFVLGKGSGATEGFKVATGNHAQIKLCNFVNYLQSDELWRNQITQIYVNAANELELVPRVGNHIILLGGLDDYENKMNKLEAMYSKGFEITDWNAYSLINLKFKDQVICKKRNNG